MIEDDELTHYDSAGRLAENMEAKIVDPITGEALPPGHKGELWLRGPTVMQGGELWFSNTVYVTHKRETV